MEEGNEDVLGLETLEFLVSLIYQDHQFISLSSICFCVRSKKTHRNHIVVSLLGSVGLWNSMSGHVWNGI